MTDGVTPLAVGDQLRLSFGRSRTVWTVAELPPGRDWDNAIRLTTSTNHVRYITWLRVSQGFAVRCNGIPIEEATHA